MAESISEKNLNSRLVQSGNREDLLRDRSGSLGNTNYQRYQQTAVTKVQNKPASATGSRRTRIEVAAE